jgi:hypothetical protein
MADTLVNTLYPPAVETFQPAFVYTDGPVVTFSISPFNAASDIKYIHVSVTDQRNNENVLTNHLHVNIIKPSRDTYKISNYFSTWYIEQTEPGEKERQVHSKGIGN